MASVLPESKFVGVDFSGRQIEIGRQSIKSLGLENIHLEHASILDVDKTWGGFDYIICHGVFSWIEKEVQDKIFAIIAHCLAENGIAYVSYNTYPGWHMREMIRHMMLYHVDQFQESGEKIQQARALLDFLVASVPADSGAYGQFLNSELELLRRCSDEYLFHEHLEQVNTPVYFHRFIERAKSYGLQYLAEAELRTMFTGNLPRTVGETLEHISPNIVQLEQYMDFVRNRLFRQTLLCRKNLPLQRALSPAVLQNLLIASRTRPETELVDLSPGNNVTFRAIGSSAQIETGSAVTKAALVILTERWPHAIKTEELISAALERASLFIPPHEAEIFRQNLMQDLFQCFLANLIQVKTWQPICALKVTERPKAFAVAAHQAKTQDFVVNVWHETVQLDRVGREVIQALNGKRDRLELTQHLIQLVRDDVLNVTDKDGQIKEEKALQVILKRALAETLEACKSNALLVA
jgi:methyltransferase-like protein/SAM-dependent methyltransferase